MVYYYSIKWESENLSIISIGFKIARLVFPNFPYYKTVGKFRQQSIYFIDYYYLSSLLSLE